jgi:PelA/Pel-15E family pectate lyase
MLTPKTFLGAVLTVIPALAMAQMPDADHYEYTAREWKHIARNADPTFLKSKEGRRIADNVMLWQRNSGGWTKNKPVHKPLTDEERKQLLSDKDKQGDTTTDNDATVTEMLYLAKIWQATKQDTYREALLKGVDFLLMGQYANGGWPQFWPQNRGDYQMRITYNDNAMVQTLEVLRDIRRGKGPYQGLVLPADLQRRIDDAFRRGIDCILKTQVLWDGEPTLWCQQHGEHTMQACGARAFELPALCSSESAHLVELLMSLPDSMQTPQVERAVEGALKTFQRLAIDSLRVENFTNGQGQKDRRVVADPKAPRIWARYYTLEELQPFFCDRDGKPRQHLSDIGYERRNGYGWYNYEPEEALKKAEKWRKRVAKRKKSPTVASQ